MTATARVSPAGRLATAGRVGPLAGRRIAIVNWRDLDHSRAGGAELYAWAFARALREAGAEVDFVTGRDHGQRRHDRRDGIAVHRGGGGFGYYGWAAVWLLRHRRGLDLVIDSESGIPAFAPLWVSRRTPVALVVHHVHQAQFATHFPAPLARLGQWLERVAMPRVYRHHQVVAVSESTRTEVRDQLGWAVEARLLHNGNEPVATEQGSYDDAALAAAKDPDRVVVLGRVVEHKRVDLVVRVVAALAAERPQLRLDVVGDGDGLPRVRELVSRLGLGDRVVCHGFVDEQTKAELLHRAALHVCASDAEGWGQVVIEAAASGTPTVARNVPGLRDSVVDGRTGRLVAEPADHDLDEVQRRLTGAVRTALEELAAPGARTHAVHQARAWAAGFTWAAMRRDAVALVADLLAPEPHAAARGSHPFRTTAPTTER